MEGTQRERADSLNEALDKAYETLAKVKAKRFAAREEARKLRGELLDAKAELKQQRAKVERLEAFKLLLELRYLVGEEEDSMVSLERLRAKHIQTIDIVFDGPPAHKSGRFVEVEDAEGHGIRVGEWVKRPDGYDVLRIARVLREGTANAS